MVDFWSKNSLAIYQVSLIGSVVLACLLESFTPARAPSRAPGWRWLNNLALAVLNHAVLLLVMPLLYLGVVAILGLQGTGLLRRFDVSPFFAFVIFFLCLEFVGYWIHRAFHAFAPLWRLHAVHHSDTELDFSTAHRHHTLEVILTALATLPFVLLLGPDVRVLVAYQVVSSLVVALSHANVSLGVRPNKTLKWLVVTPDFHRVHHSAEQRFTNSHYGTLSPVFDHMFGTATPLAQVPGQDMVLGLEYFREPRLGRLDRLLVSPFRWPHKQATRLPQS